MSTIRVKKDANYFAASNEPFNDDRLSWEARGLMGYLLSKPNDWKVNQKDIMNKGQAGERKVKRMLAELRKAGYMNRIRVTLEHNKFDWITEVYESPSQNPRPSSKFTKTKSQYDVLHSLEKPLTGKRIHIVSTESLSTELRTTTTTPTAEAIAKSSNAYTLYEQNIGPLTPLISQRITGLIGDYTEAWVNRAIQEAASSNVRNIKYISAILAGYKERGSPDIGRTKVKTERKQIIPQTNTQEELQRMADDAYQRLR